MAKILVVDDDPYIRELVSMLLENVGFTIYEAADGVKALEKLTTIDVDLVILDIMMPHIDGWELCQEIRTYYEYPVLMLTAKRETHDKLKGFDLGTDDYLVKPFEPLELVARVNGLDTEVGERGVKLSGGQRQRQRIAIARAFLRDPKLLMMDEATASLDSQSEIIVQKALGQLMRGRTTLVIAHRLSTIVHTKITGKGTHEQLVGTHALYQKFAQQQLA